MAEACHKFISERKVTKYQSGTSMLSMQCTAMLSTFPTIKIRIKHMIQYGSDKLTAVHAQDHVKSTRTDRDKEKWMCVFLTIWKIKLLRTHVTVLPISLSIKNWMITHKKEWPTWYPERRTWRDELLHSSRTRPSHNYITVYLQYEDFW